MKHVKEARLSFKEGKSDKVYEVDLCMLDEGQYVVNFRYGRRGSSLREGTKTVFPVGHEEANTTFNDLVNSKIKKGYKEEGASDPVFETSAQQNDRNLARDEAVLSYLNKGDNYNPEHWPMSRAIWRAGELNLNQGANRILQFLNSSDSMEVYSAIWALGRIGSDAGIVSVKSKMLSWVKTDKKFRIACAYILNQGSENDKQVALGQIMSNWPAEFIDVITNKKVGEFEALLNSYYDNEGKHISVLLTDLYLVSNYTIWIRPFLLNILKRIAFKPNYFKAVRYIYKLAEFTTDFEIITILGKRFYYDSPYFNKGWGYVWLDGKSVEVEKELSKETSRLAFSGNTSLYFKNRVLKYLKRSVDFSNQNYVALAKQILLTANEDSDNLTPIKERVLEYDYNIWQEVDKGVRFYPAYTNYSTLMYIVYGNSGRYQKSKTGSWYIQDENHDASFEDVGREEAHPYIWDKFPDDVIDIIVQSESKVVSDFAVRIFRANKSFKPYVNIQNVLAFLIKKHKETSVLGVELAKEILNSGQVGVDLVFALMGCELKEGEELGVQYFNKVVELFTNDQEYLTKAIQSGNAFLFNYFIGLMNHNQTKTLINLVQLTTG